MENFKRKQISKSNFQNCKQKEGYQFNLLFVYIHAMPKTVSCIYYHSDMCKARIEEALCHSEPRAKRVCRRISVFSLDASTSLNMTQLVAVFMYYKKAHSAFFYDHVPVMAKRTPNIRESQLDVSMPAAVIIFPLPRFVPSVRVQ